MSAGFKIVPTFGGDADVLDRASGEPVGSVLRNVNGVWEAFAMGSPAPHVGQSSTRSGAALLVWEHHVEGRASRFPMTGEQEATQ